MRRSVRYEALCPIRPRVCGTRFGEHFSRSCRPTANGCCFCFSPDELSGVQHRVKVLSYPQYCRFRSLQKRIQSHAGWSSPQDPHLLALGWIKMTLHNTRILYCRDTFSHPSLGTNASLIPEFGEFTARACVFNERFYISKKPSNPVQRNQLCLFDLSS